MNYNNAKEQFEKYLNSYDRDNGKVRLKIIHTCHLRYCFQKPVCLLP